MSLAEKSCTSCKDLSVLSEPEILAALSQLDEWEYVEDEGVIYFRRSFKNYGAALSFVNKVSQVAERENHHPDICFGWGYCEIILTSHDAGGVTENDLIMAAKINKIG